MQKWLTKDSQFFGPGVFLWCDNSHFILFSTVCIILFLWAHKNMARQRLQFKSFLFFREQESHQLGSIISLFARTKMTRTGKDGANCTLYACAVCVIMHGSKQHYLLACLTEEQRLWNGCSSCYRIVMLKKPPTTYSGTD